MSVGRGDVYARRRLSDVQQRGVGHRRLMASANRASADACSGSFRMSTRLSAATHAMPQPSSCSADSPRNGGSSSCTRTARGASVA